MIEIAALNEGYALNLKLVQQYTQDLSHEQSLIVPDFEANCLNWVIGHMAVNRGRVLDLLGFPRVLGNEEKEIYETGSPPILANRPEIIKLPRLLDLVSKAQSVLSSAFESTPREKWSEMIQVEDHQMTIARRVFGFYFHETFHTGQVEILAALSRGR